MSSVRVDVSSAPFAVHRSIPAAPAPHRCKSDRAEQLIVLPLPMRRVAGGRGFLFEAQACNGLARWADHFESLIVAAPVVSDQEELPTMSWQPVESIAGAARIEFVPLPFSRTRKAHRAALPQAQKALAEMIARAQYLHFGIFGLYGDWACVGAEEAIRLGRPYMVHMDCVEYQLIRRKARSKPFLKRMKSRVLASMVRRQHERVIANAALSMCHGADTYEAYRHLNRNSFLVHNVHTTQDDQIAPQAVEAKASRATAGDELRICYAGRADTEKAPLQWVDAIAHAIRRGAKLKAVWLGDGALLEEAKARAARHGVSDKIEFAGFIADHAQVLARMRDADLFVFTHIGLESPRCLIEALVSGTPIAGYQSPYSSDLIKEHSGGVLTAKGDSASLGEAIFQLEQNRPRMSELIGAAANDGRQFTSDAVFRHRAELIKRYLPRTTRS